MTNMTKFLIATGVTAVGVGLTVYYGKKLQEKKEVVISDIEDDGTPVIEDKNPSILKRIKTAATKKVVKILAWAVLHEQQLQAFATLLSVGAGIFHLVSAAKDYYTGEKTRKTLDSLMDHNMEFRDIWNSHMDGTHDRHDAVMKKLEDIHLDMGGIHQIQEALVPESA